MQYHFSFTTRRAAEVAGVHPHVVLTSFRRNGHWLGIVPIKLPNGHLRWPSVAVYEALGRLPKSPRRTPSDDIREAACAATGADAFHAHKVISGYLLAELPTPDDDRAAEGFEALKTRGRHLLHLIDAFGATVRNALVREEHLSRDDWHDCNNLAASITRSTEAACRPLLWRDASSVEA